jgi:hypothetical protein
MVLGAGTETSTTRTRSFLRCVMSSDGEDASFFDAEGGLASENEAQPLPLSGRWPPRDRHAASELQSNRNTASVSKLATSQTLQLNSAVKGYLSKSRNRYSLPEPVPAVPAIPAHLLATGKRATVLQRTTATPIGDASKELAEDLDTPLSLQLPNQRPSTSYGESGRSASRASLSRGHDETITVPTTPRSANVTRRQSRSAATAQVHSATLERLENRSGRGRSESMDRLRGRRNEDLFLELANDHADGDAVRPPSRSERVSSRLSFTNKRRSLPADRGAPSSLDNRPKTSGNAFGHRPSSRMDSSSSELHRHTERFRNSPSRAGYQADDSVSLSGLSNSARRHRYSVYPERSTMSPSRLAESIKSPDLPQYGRRRPSFGTTTSSQAQKSRTGQLSGKTQDSYSESPAESTDPKRSLPDSTDVESETADTVWDELDDLKSRIKKLELTGKLPPTSGAAVSGDSSERPRTATTAPTTIDSSPKHDKPEKRQPKPEPQPEPEPTPEQTASENFVGGPGTAYIHPNLHSALRKAKSLLNGPLYRSLEATAADALQLAAMTGGAGPQGTAFTAAAIINGATVSERHVRRKADTMCRNLTDLCLALCEGKHEASSIMQSPVTYGTPTNTSPSVRYPRNSLGPNDSLPRNNSRPMSRLEARRTSMLGSQAGSSIGNSPSGGEDVSASEQETTPSHSQRNDVPRINRPASRFQRARRQRYAADSAGEDEDPTIRPVSRAMTDISRTKPAGPREFSTPQRSPGLRDSLVARLNNAAAYENNRELVRVASLNSDSGRSRRFHDPSTPPVLEEEVGEGDDYQPSSASTLQPTRRVMSLNRHAPRRTVGDFAGRTASLTQRRQVAVE